MLGLHKQQHVRVQPGELHFQLTKLFPWQEATFPCIYIYIYKKKIYILYKYNFFKRESEREGMRERAFFPTQDLLWSLGESSKTCMRV